MTMELIEYDPIIIFYIKMSKFKYGTKKPKFNESFLREAFEHVFKGSNQIIQLFEKELYRQVLLLKFFKQYKKYSDLMSIMSYYNGKNIINVIEKSDLILNNWKIFVEKHLTPLFLKDVYYEILVEWCCKYFAIYKHKLPSDFKIIDVGIDLKNLLNNFEIKKNWFDTFKKILVRHNTKKYINQKILKDDLQFYKCYNDIKNTLNPLILECVDKIMMQSFLTTTNQPTANEEGTERKSNINEISKSKKPQLSVISEIENDILQVPVVEVNSVKISDNELNNMETNTIDEVTEENYNHHNKTNSNNELKNTPNVLSECSDHTTELNSHQNHNNEAIGNSTKNYKNNELKNIPMVVIEYFRHNDEIFEIKSVENSHQNKNDENDVDCVVYCHQNGEVSEINSNQYNNEFSNLQIVKIDSCYQDAQDIDIETNKNHHHNSEREDVKYHHHHNTITTDTNFEDNSIDNSQTNSNNETLSNCIIISDNESEDLKVNKYEAHMIDENSKDNSNMNNVSVLNNIKISDNESDDLKIVGAENSRQDAQNIHINSNRNHNENNEKIIDNKTALNYINSLKAYAQHHDHSDAILLLNIIDGMFHEPNS